MRARTGLIVKRKPRRKGAKYLVGASNLRRSENGKRHRLQRRGQKKAHARDLVKALLPDIDLRHTAATLLVGANIPVIGG